MTGYTSPRQRRLTASPTARHRLTPVERSGSKAVSTPRAAKPSRKPSISFLFAPLKAEATLSSVKNLPGKATQSRTAAIFSAISFDQYLIVVEPELTPDLLRRRR
jgi:hypothetical protein